jgi:competence protein ComEC
MAIMAAKPMLSVHYRPAEPRYYPLALIVCALAAGIVADRCLSLGTIAWWLAAAAALAMGVALWLLRRERFSSCALLAGALAVGGAWHHAWWRLYSVDEIGRLVQEDARPLCVEAIAIQSPRWVPAPPPTPLRTIPVNEQSELIVWLTAVRDGERFRPASGCVELVVGGALDHVRAGDRLRIMAQASRPAAPLNPGEFDFAAYERARRVCCRLFAEFPESVELVARGSVWSPRRWLADVRSGGSALLRRYIANERATLASAVLLGAREQLDSDRNEDYLVTGTIHVLSISGLHVGILAAGFFFMLRSGLVSRRVTLVTTMALTVAYAVLTDLEPPVVRATILVIAACLGLWTGRSSIGFNALAAAGIVVLVLNPASLFMTGTQLSFLAVATMIALERFLLPKPILDPLDRLIAASRPWLVRAGRHLGGALWRLWLTGAVIWLVSVPLVWKQYHLISPVALVLNFVMWLPVTLAMYSGLGTLLLGSLAPIAARLCGLTCDRCLDWLERAIALGRDWPGSHHWLAAPPGCWIGLFYAALTIWTAFPALRPPRRWIVGLGLMWIGGALWLSGQFGSRMARYPSRPLVCHFVAVGHGVSVLVELPDGQNLLYDSGRLGSPMSGLRPISSVLWSRGIRHLDAIVISHADADHFNAIPGLLKRFSVGAIYVSPVMFDTLPPAVNELRDSINRSRVAIREIHGGQNLAAGSGTRISVLHPPRKGVYGSDNANSIVLLVEHAGRRILLTGDLESPGLDDVLAEEPLDCDVVLAPHHGSPRSSPGKFAEWSRPEHVVISGRRGLADAAMVESVKHSFRLRGAEVFHTAEDGCVRVEVSPRGLSVASTRPHIRATTTSLTSVNLLQAE